MAAESSPVDYKQFLFDHVLQCEICTNNYDLLLRLPCALPCEHMLCQQCVNTLPLIGDEIVCPMCRTKSTKDQTKVDTSIKRILVRLHEQKIHNNHTEAQQSNPLNNETLVIGTEIIVPKATTANTIPLATHSDKSQATQPTIYDACQSGDLETVKLLVTAGGIDINKPDEKDYTPLHYACEKGHFELVKFLVCEAKAIVDQPCKLGFTGLLLASKTGHLNIVKYLVEEGKSNVKQTTNTGDCVLYLAAATNQIHVGAISYFFNES